MNKNCTYTSDIPKELNEEELKKLFSLIDKKKSEGMILLPKYSGYDIFVFSEDVIRKAIYIANEMIKMEKQKVGRVKR